MISAIICTHNPAQQLITEAISSLRLQSLPKSEWELLVVDNSSQNAPPVEQLLDLSWHPQARCIRETTLGLTTARLTGYRAARNEILVYIDDDNLLDPNYLKAAQHIGNSFSQLGVWGAGNIKPRFEVPPEEWTRKYWYLLALREQEQETWSNFPSSLTNAVGAGMCVRRNVMAKYAELVATSCLRSSLDPIGQQLNRAGDQDIFLTAYDLNLGVGIFPSLQMTHVIPAFRLKEEYLIKLVDGYVYSNSLLNWIRRIEAFVPTPIPKQLYQKIRPWIMPRRQRRFYQTAITALARAEHDHTKLLLQDKLIHSRHAHRVSQ